MAVTAQKKGNKLSRKAAKPGGNGGLKGEAGVNGLAAEQATSGIVSRERIALKDLEVHEEFQSRFENVPDAEREYAEAYREGGVEALPPIEVCRVTGRNLVTDGFHRHRGAVEAGLTEMDCFVVIGTRETAIRMALSANATHGIRRSRQDRRHAVELAFREGLINLSDREIASICRVSRGLVAEVRAQTGHDSPGVVVGKDGKGYRVAQRAADPGPDPEDEVEEEGIAEARAALEASEPDATPAEAQESRNAAALSAWLGTLPLREELRAVSEPAAAGFEKAAAAVWRVNVSQAWKDLKILVRREAREIRTEGGARAGVPFLDRLMGIINNFDLHEPERWALCGDCGGSGSHRDERGRETGHCERCRSRGFVS